MRRPAGCAALAMTLVLGCAVGRGPSGPVRSPTGIVYPPGVPPAETRFSQTATLYLNIDGEEEAALAQALEGIEADPENSIHYFLAGVAEARLGEYREAHRWFVEAERIYPAYELDIEPEREAAWARAFNAGLEAYARGERDAAAEYWLGATAIYDLRPAAHRNVASLLVELGRRDEAIGVYRDALHGLDRRPATRVLEEDEVRERAELRGDTENRLVQLLLAAGCFADAEPLLRRQLARDPGSIRVRSSLARTLVELGRADEAAELYASLLTDESLAAADLFNLGIALFRSSRFEQAGRAFALLTERQPDSRDAWFNYANALFAAEAWAGLADAGDRLLAVDPLSESAHLITARARLETGDEAGARAGVARADGLPVHLEELKLSVTDGGTVVQGRIVGNALPEGAPLRLRFIFHDNAGPLGERVLEASAPAPGASADFRVSIEGRALGYRYELQGEGTGRAGLRPVPATPGCPGRRSAAGGVRGASFVDGLYGEDEFVAVDDVDGLRQHASLGEKVHQEVHPSHEVPPKAEGVAVERLDHPQPVLEGLAPHVDGDRVAALVVDLQGDALRAAGRPGLTPRRGAP